MHPSSQDQRNSSGQHEYQQRRTTNKSPGLNRPNLDQSSRGANNNSGKQQRQEGAVQAFKIANDAASYLNGNLVDLDNGMVGATRTTPTNARQPVNKSKAIAGQTATAATNQAVGGSAYSRTKANKSPIIVASSNPVNTPVGSTGIATVNLKNVTNGSTQNGATGKGGQQQRAGATGGSVLAQSVVGGSSGAHHQAASQLSSYNVNQRNTPTIVSLSGHTASGAGGTSGSGKMHESQSMAEVVVAADGTTTVGHYKLGRDLGKGTFGKVKVGTHTLTGEKVAIKVLEKDKIIDVNDVDRVAREIKILKIVRHPVVVQLYEIVETQKELYLIMEYARGGELFEYIVNRKRVREKEAAKFLLQLISGIEYLHRLGICHRDLKPENLLMDDYNNIKIVDFGLSNTYRPGQTLKTACGSPCYAAPEMVAGKHYHGLPADVWSCGVILYAMVCGYLPFEDPKTNVLYKKILNADYTIPEFVSEDCRDLMTKILNTDPTKRFTATEIRQHIWFKQIKNVKDYPGIIIGQNPIPVDFEKLQAILDKYPFDEGTRENARRMVEANKHNPLTTCYYLTLKRFIRSGGKSIADITKYNPEQIERMIQNELVKQHQNQLAAAENNSKNVGGDVAPPSSTTAASQSRKLVMSFEVPAGAGGASSKAKTEEKAHGAGSKQPHGGFVVQVSGSTEAAFDNHNVAKRANGPLPIAPIELTSKLEGAEVTGDGLVNYETGGAPPASGSSGIMTVATIKPAQKQASDSNVIQISNITRNSVASDHQNGHRPILTKQKQKIISSQDRPNKVFGQQPGVGGGTGKNQRPMNSNDQKKSELFQRQIDQQPPRNQTSCNNRQNVHHHHKSSAEKASNGENQRKQTGSNTNFAASVIIAQGEQPRKAKAVSQLARNSNLHFGSSANNNYSGLVATNSTGTSRQGGNLQMGRVDPIKARQGGVNSEMGGPNGQGGVPRQSRYHSNHAVENTPSSQGSSNMAHVFANSAHQHAQLHNLQYQEAATSASHHHHQLQSSPSPHSYFKNKQAQKNLLMTSQNMTQIVTSSGNAMANETFELAQRQIQNQRKLMQMTHNQFSNMGGSAVAQYTGAINPADHHQNDGTNNGGNNRSSNHQVRLQNFANRGNSQPQGSPMKLIPSKLTRKQILANALANQAQLPMVNAQGGATTGQSNSQSVQRRKPKTGNQYQGYATASHNNTSASDIPPHSQLIFQGPPNQIQMSPANILNSAQQPNATDMQYMYLTPRELINFQSSNGKVHKPSQLNFGPPTGPLMINNANFGGGAANGSSNAPNTTQANYFKNVVRLSQQPIMAHGGPNGNASGASTSHQVHRRVNHQTGQNSKLSFQGGNPANATTAGFMSRQTNQSPGAGAQRNTTNTNGQFIHSSLPASVKGNHNTGANGSSTSVMRRRTQGGSNGSNIQNTNNMIDWPAHNSSQNVAGGSQTRATTRGSGGGNPLNQTHLNLGSFKKQGMTSSKIGGIQSILNKVNNSGGGSKASQSNGANNPNSQANGQDHIHQQKAQMSRSMNVQEILNQSMENKRLNNSMINQSQEVSRRGGFVPAGYNQHHQYNHHLSPTGSQFDATAATGGPGAQVTAQNYMLPGGPNGQPTTQGGTSGKQGGSTQASKQAAALKKKHFQFQTSQFTATAADQSSMMNQTQVINPHHHHHHHPHHGAPQAHHPHAAVAHHHHHAAQYALPMSSYDLTQINLNSAGNVVTTTSATAGPPQGPSNNGGAPSTTANYGPPGKFKVSIEFQPN